MEYPLSLLGQQVTKATSRVSQPDPESLLGLWWEQQWYSRVSNHGNKQSKILWSFATSWPIRKWQITTVVLVGQPATWDQSSTSCGNNWFYWYCLIGMWHNLVAWNLQILIQSIHFSGMGSMQWLRVCLVMFTFRGHFPYELYPLHNKSMHTWNVCIFLPLWEFTGMLLTKCCLSFFSD